ncbi:MAG: 2-oxoacid:acceptor oxidoreductase subunit alpha [Calditrichaeota bacterium]|nr:2-oxoacid:acceptor oxidoreductase subunit alpha [Calditrichota bacterium]
MKHTIEKVKSPIKPGEYFLMGDEASADGAIAAGCNFFAGYPITPASEIMVRMVHRLRETDGSFIQMEDEIGSICAMIGASWAGSKAMTATSGPGLSLMMEGLGYAAITEAPIVIVDVQRAGPATGQATRPGSGDVFQVKYGSHGDYEIIALSPWSVQEVFDLTLEAFNLAEAYRVPVFVLADESVGHLRERVIVPEEVERWNRPFASGAPPFDTDDPKGIPSMPAFGQGEHLLVTGSTHDGKGYRKTQDAATHEKLVKRLVGKIRNAADEISRCETYQTDDADILIVAYGFSARASLDAISEFRSKGVKVGLFRPVTLWPFPEKGLLETARGVKHIVVPEMNYGQVSREVERILHREITALPQVDGEGMRPGTIVDGIEQLIGRAK